MTEFLNHGDPYAIEVMEYFMTWVNFVYNKIILNRKPHNFFFHMAFTIEAI